MGSKLTWEEIKSKYPDQWVSIVEPESTETGILSSGTVIGSNKDKNAVISEFKEQKKKGINYNVHTFRYTGIIPNLVGIYKIEFKNV